MNDTRYIVLISIAIGFALFCSFFIALLNIRKRQRAYSLLQNQKEETDIQRQRLEQALAELEAAQAQLIQKEKMASLGELTAGIAHEIQNPLNFVKNFSEVSIELIEELNEEVTQGNSKNAASLIKTIDDNLKTISFHSNRADSIIKSMMQHSRTSNGKKEATDLNALANEYLRLSYQGLRAKDKSFNATMHTDLDKNIVEAQVISQDLGRAFLNLFNNAFYSVSEKKKKLGEGFEPSVWLSTKKIQNKIEIIVRDNGCGISSKNQEKILQPFFTTKPAGQGTGLGLSLTYDIIKAHGGELKIDSKEGEYAEFKILLPQLP
ncbi:MAG: ATP-binding protein [Chitinophagaceae bacterium]